MSVDRVNPPTASAPMASPPGEWRRDPDAVQPVVLILEGFSGSLPTYRGLARDLERRGVAGTEIAQIWLPDWLISSVRGMGPIVNRAGRALLRASAWSAESPLSRGAPVLVVGHSTGAIIARILTSPDPFGERRMGAAGRIGAIVSLGSPYNVVEERRFGRTVGNLVAHFAAEHVPGAFFAPRIGYVSVASRAIKAGPESHGVMGRWAWNAYRGLLAPERQQQVDGDGLVPIECALLEGSRPVILDGFFHAEVPRGRPWYGSPDAIDQWWPAALEAWHSALRARVELDHLA